MEITVIVATHKKYWMPEDKCYLPLQVGRGISSDIGYAGDDTGIHITSRNPYYCELTGLYWMWRNIKTDYVGLVHYRRYFAKRFFLPWTERKKRIAGEQDIRRVLEHADIILPPRRRYYIETIYSHYAHTHYSEHLDITRSILVRLYPEYVKAFDKVMKSRSAHMFNMFIMSREKCAAYCEWLFDILFRLERHIDLDAYDSYQARLFGRISEILLNVWIEKNQYSYSVMPVVTLERVHWPGKIRSFLRAKFAGKKYSSSF